jgi:hypothetical protein
VNIEDYRNSYSLYIRYILQTKFGDIYLKECYYENYKIINRDKMFPSSENPHIWPGCDDAYYYTWTRDPTRQLTGLNRNDIEKLARSAGFCPHSRCQLRNLTEADFEGKCPDGLCYTRLEVILCI